MLVDKECVGQFNPVVNLTHLHHRWPAVQSEGGPGSDQPPFGQLGLRGSQDDLLDHSQPDAQLFEPARMNDHITPRRVRNAQADPDSSKHEPRWMVGRSADVGQDHRAEERGRPKGGAREGLQIARREAGNRLDHQVAPSPGRLIADHGPWSDRDQLSPRSPGRTLDEHHRHRPGNAWRAHQGREVPAHTDYPTMHRKDLPAGIGIILRRPTITSRANSTRDLFP